jgi:PAS domain S-box-containing protein
MHRLLKLQIDKLFGDNTKFSDDVLAFIELVGKSYQSFQNDFNQLERTLELSSKESFKELSDFQSAVDTAAIVSVTDTNGTIIRANQNFSNISGYSIAELVGSNHSIVNSGHHSQSFFEKLWNTIKGGEVWQGQIKNKKKDGSFYWTNTNIIPLINDNGIAYQYVAIRFDISEKKIAEEKLIQSERNLAEILAAINRTTASIEFTPDGVITEANQLFLDLFDYKKEEIIGKQHSIFVKVGENNYNDFWAEIGKGKIIGGEFKRVKKNGESIWIIGNYNPVLHENKEVKHIIKFVVDITDKKLAETKLQESETRFRSLAQYSSDIITILKPDFTTTYSSPSFFRIFGYEETEIIGKNIFDFIHNDDIELVSKVFGNGLSVGGVTEAIEFKFKHKNGNWVCIESIGNNLLDIKGINGIVINSRDITERKKAQKEVEKLKTFYEKVLNKIPADIVVFDKQHKYIFINPLSIKNDGLRAWLIGKDDYDYCEYRNRPKELADHRRKLFNDVFEAKVQYEFEESVTNEKGEKIWMLRRMFPVLNENNEVENIIGFGLDITDRKLAEIKTLKAQGELEEAQHIAKVGGWELDVETNSISWTNEMFVIHELPFSYEPTINTAYDFFNEVTSSLVIDKIKASIEKMEEFEVEAKIKTARGNIVEIRTKGVPVIDNNKVISLRGIFQDITKEKEAERQLKEYSEVLELKNKELDQFAYIVSHDLKAPLRGINNLSIWIEEDLGDLLKGDIKDSFDMMRGRVKRMELLINGILEYSRAGRVKQDVETFDLKPMLHELVDSLSPAEKFKIIIPDNLPTLTAERISFEQIFANYISNGLKYNKNPEPIITVSYIINNDMYEFCVADNGDGIDKQFHEKVFVIFQTLQSRDIYESTGVGLAIVKKIVEDNGGQVWIDSEIGFGAKFFFSWPIDL